MLKSMLMTGLGGFFGTCTRFLVGRLAQYLFTSPFPYGTFVVNVVGCFLIGIFFGLAERTQLISSGLNLFLITGFCGGFTTFSSFSHDTLVLMENRHWGYVALYVGVSVVLGIVMVWLGRSVVKPA